MNSCRFNMLHNPHYMEFFSITYRIDLRFLATVKEMIDQDLITRNMFQQAYHCLFHFFIIEHDTHSLSAQYIRRTNQHWVTYFIRYFNGFIHIIGCSIIRIRYCHFFQHITEPSTIFSNIHAVIRSTNDLYSFLVKFLSHLKRGLSTQLYYYSIWFLMFNDLPNMFPVYWLEVELIGHIKIRGNSFRITIDHDRFISAFFDCKQTMHTAIVKFNSLADPVRT